LIQQEEYEVKCAWCGFALKTIEIAGEFYGSYVDFETHGRGEANPVFCSECWQVIKDRQNESMQVAIDRRKRAFGGDR
jgi:hypothetical protein